MIVPINWLFLFCQVSNIMFPTPTPHNPKGCIWIQKDHWNLEVDSYKWMNVLYGGFGMTTNQMASKSWCLLLNGGGGLRKTTNPETWLQISMVLETFRELARSWCHLLIRNALKWKFKDNHIFKYEYEKLQWKDGLKWKIFIWGEIQLKGKRFQQRGNMFMKEMVMIKRKYFDEEKSYDK